MRLKIDRIARPYEGCHISDGVGDHELATQATGDVQCLVKITRTGRVDGDQFQVCPVKIGKARLGGSFLSGGLDIGRKLGWDLDGCPNGRQALRQLLRHNRWQSEFAGGHDRSLTVLDASLAKLARRGSPFVAAYFVVARRPKACRLAPPQHGDARSGSGRSVS
jgi:hypothetical protein